MPVETEGLTEFRMHVAPPEPPLEYDYHTIFGGHGIIRVIADADEQHPTNISFFREIRNQWVPNGVVFKINEREFCVVKDSDAEHILRRMCGKLVVHITDEEAFYE